MTDEPERCAHKNVEIIAVETKEYRPNPNEPAHVMRCKDCDRLLEFCDDCAFRVAASHLAGCAIFTLGNYKHLARGSGMVVNLKTMKTVGPWQDKFFNALDLIGYEIDREAYFKPKPKKKAKTNAKAHANARGKKSRPRSSRRSRPA